MVGLAGDRGGRAPALRVTAARPRLRGDLTKFVGTVCSDIGMRPHRSPLAPSLALVATLVAACGTPASTTRPATGAPSAAASATAPSAVATPAASAAYAPIARSSASMTWDPTSQTILMYGGDSNAGPSNAMDAWDGTAWKKVTALGPRARDDGLFVADPDRGVVILSGGRSGQTVLTDTWEWDGTAWKDVTAHGPSPRAHAAAAYDPTSKRMILYGGVDDAGTRYDTWAWDGTAWTELDTKGIPGRVANYMAWDATLEQLLVLAVNLDAETSNHLYPSELWGWTGTRWKLVADGGPSFSPLQRFVEGPKHPYLIDGGGLQNHFSMYEWTGGADWTVLAGAAPSARNGQAAAWDPVRKQLVMFGGFLGNTVFGDTWIFESGAWREVAG